MPDDHDPTKARVELRGVLQNRHAAGPDPDLEARLDVNEVSYVVVGETGPASPTCDMRRAPRARTRLRSGKIARLDGVFICHCRIHDRSPSGMRLDLEKSAALPSQFLLFDDGTGEAMIVRTIWRRGVTLGIRIMPTRPPVLNPVDAYVLRTSHYAIPKR